MAIGIRDETERQRMAGAHRVVYRPVFVQTHIDAYTRLCSDDYRLADPLRSTVQNGWFISKMWEMLDPWWEGDTGPSDETFTGLGIRRKH